MHASTLTPADQRVYPFPGGDRLQSTNCNAQVLLFISHFLLEHFFSIELGNGQVNFNFVNVETLILMWV